MKMKNKKTEQEAKKLESKRLLAEAKRKKRMSSSDLQREEIETSEEKQSFLIVCEGQNTEKSYFDQFKIPNAEITTIGTGHNTVSLVQYTKKIVDSKKEKGSTFDQIWCVFDKDDFDSFDQAIQLAIRYGFKVAYSNQAFEYWLILHFNDHQGGAMPRTDYSKRINGEISKYGAFYDADGSKMVDENFFTYLQSINPTSKKSRQQEAISRAKKIFENKIGMKPSLSESITTVYQLIMEIVDLKED